MPFIDTGELFQIGGVSIHIGVNALALLMVIISAFSIWGLVRSFKSKNLIAIIFGAAATLTFGFFTVATIFTFGYPDLAH